ncbi:VWA domain-containing protein [Candidatus Methylospira mobilis]|uniref:VWA domain-containing protein n=1 Tax=Candidatus Methylospira mobilis TaxID=1808979 RepID=A0A5Q0BJY9_9GAMM|nr:VWA domain-containing protein [Candidatus Methylospira mobilis]QFY43442.1 VWA domain-containing protein [Candidatus Methylospira mobilis]WNV03319.1 VWA domain-containing protein [Candidatus Methylospira mobilis]
MRRFLVQEWQRTGWRFKCLAAANLMLLPALFGLSVPLPQPVFRYNWVIDITQSMNVQDYHDPAMPADRLHFVTASLRRALPRLACGSEAGLSLFAGQQVLPLFEPIEVCEHRALLDQVLERLDSRMAWTADSDIAVGLAASMRQSSGLQPAVVPVFFSDGQQFPPGAALPNFPETAKGGSGLIVGVGGSVAVPVPRLDRDNRLIGYWEQAELEKFLPPGADRTDSASGFYLSRLDERHLLELAALTGYSYHRLQTPDALPDVLQSRDFGRVVWVSGDRPELWIIIALCLIFATLAAPA